MKENPKDIDIIYQIGMRDSIANLFMEIRHNGIEKALKTYAEMLKDNPHAIHYLKSLK